MKFYKDYSEENTRVIREGSIDLVDASLDAFVGISFITLKVMEVIGERKARKAAKAMSLEDLDKFEI